MTTDANTAVESSPTADANTAVESSTTDAVQDSGIDLESLSGEQYDHWMLKGELPEAKPAEIATQPPNTDEAPD